MHTITHTHLELPFEVDITEGDDDTITFGGFATDTEATAFGEAETAGTEARYTVRRTGLADWQRSVLVTFEHSLECWENGATLSEGCGHDGCTETVMTVWSTPIGLQTISDRLWDEQPDGLVIDGRAVIG